MGKNKKVELRISTILNKQILFTINKDEVTKLQNREKLTKASWENLRRKPQYRKLCDDIEFNRLGLVKTTWYQYGSIENKKLREKEDEARRLFGIQQLLDPDKSYEKLTLIIHLVDVNPVPIEAIASKNSEYSIHMTDKDFNNPRRFIEDGKYLTLKIDIKQKDKYINDSLKLYLEYYRQFTGKEQGRDHSEKQAEFYYKVWDERMERTPFSKIAFKFGKQEETVKKQFRRAFELIVGRKYTKNKWKKLIKEKLSREERHLELVEFEETKQQHKMLKTDHNEVADNEFYNPEKIAERKESLVQKIKKKFCKDCPDIECRSAVYKGDLEVFQNCPQVIAFLES